MSEVVQISSNLVHPRYRCPMTRELRMTVEKERDLRNEGPRGVHDHRESHGTLIRCHLTSPACRVGLGRSIPRRGACPRNPEQVKMFFRGVMNAKHDH